MIFYRAAQPLLQSLFGAIATTLKHTPGLSQKSEKIWKTWDLRKSAGRPTFESLDPAIFKGQKPIWIHAASGEFEYAKPVIREIAKQNLAPTLVTYFSPTYAENVRKFPGVTASCPLPLDSRDELEGFLSRFQPAALLIARTDAWPNTVLATSLRKIPILLFSTTFHDGSKRTSWLARRLTRITLSQINEIQCVSDDDRKILSEMGLDRVNVSGDTRYDQVLERLNSPKPATVVAQIEALKTLLEPKVFIAGSIWREDLEPVLWASHETQLTSPHTLILVPHEISPSFLSEIEAQCEKIGFEKRRTIRLSRISKTSASEQSKLQIVLVDAIGLLAELYTLGQIAFVGGSFKGSVHSVMEPLAAGCLTMVGPFHKNNREATEFQALKAPNHKTRFVTAVDNKADFARELAALWGEVYESTTSMKDLVRNEVKKRGGATEKVLQWLRAQV